MSRNCQDGGAPFPPSLICMQHEPAQKVSQGLALIRLKKAFALRKCSAAQMVVDLTSRDEETKDNTPSARNQKLCICPFLRAETDYPAMTVHPPSKRDKAGFECRES